MKLSDLPRGQHAYIERIDANDTLTRKLLEMGFLEGMQITLLHEGPFRGDPMAIIINDRCIALRRNDAAHILIRASGS